MGSAARRPSARLDSAARRPRTRLDSAARRPRAQLDSAVAPAEGATAPRRQEPTTLMVALIIAIQH